MAAVIAATAEYDDNVQKFHRRSYAVESSKRSVPILLNSSPTLLNTPSILLSTTAALDTADIFSNSILHSNNLEYNQRNNVYAFEDNKNIALQTNKEEYKYNEKMYDNGREDLYNNIGLGNYIRTNDNHNAGNIKNETTATLRVSILYIYMHYFFCTNLEYKLFLNIFLIAYLYKIKVNKI